MRFFGHFGSIPRHLGHFLRGHTPRHLRLRNHLLTMILVTIVVDAVASYFMWKAEKDILIQPPAGASYGVDANWSHIRDYWDASFFTTTQLLTVSSLMNNPYSAAGRIIDVFLEAYGVTVVGALAGAFGAFFLAGRLDVGDASDDEGEDQAPGSTGPEGAGGPSPAPA